MTSGYVGSRQGESELCGSQVSLPEFELIFTDQLKGFLPLKRSTSLRSEFHPESSHFVDGKKLV